MLRPPSPPYAVPPAVFRFTALARLVGRLPLGAGREAAMATLLAARLADGVLPPNVLPAPTRAMRASAAAHWLSGACPDAKVRAACSALIDATTAGHPEIVARAVQRVIEVTSGQLDAGARAELTALAKAFQSAK